MNPLLQRWKSLQGAAVPIAVLALAEIGFHAAIKQSDSLAPPSRIVGGFAEIVGNGMLARATAETLATMLSGFALGAGCGLALGIALGFSRLAQRASFLTIEMLRPIPAIALLPLSLLVFGFGYRMEIAVIAFATFWPVLILTQSAVAQIDSRLIEVAKLMGLGRLAFAAKIVLPAAAPRLLTALRLAAGLALVVAVTAEIVSNPQGLGHLLMISQENLRPERMFAALAWVGLIGLAINSAALAIQRWLFANRGEIDTEIAA